MADNKQNNIKLYASIKKFFEDTKAKLTGKAEVDLSNIKLSAADAGKLLSVKTDGGIELVDKAGVLSVLGLIEKVIPIGERTIWVDHDKIAAVDAAVWEPAGITEGYTIGQGSSTGEDTGEIKSHTYTQNPHNHTIYDGRGTSTGRIVPATDDNTTFQTVSTNDTTATNQETGGAANKAAIRKGTFYKNKVELVEFIKSTAKGNKNV